MGKAVFIAEKPSVAKEFAKALKENMSSKDGYLESSNYIVTWCVGHLVSMSYPESYDPNLKRWSFDTIPFIPEEYKYQVIPSVAKQFGIVSNVLNRADVDTIYVCTDSGREGEYIYRLVEAQAGVTGKTRKRVWIDSQTEEEILRGIREAKDLSEYDNLSASAYLRAKEDYLMGINFSRVLSLKYSYSIRQFLNTQNNCPIAVGRVMTCVLGMIVRREREIRSFTKTPFYRVIANVPLGNSVIKGEWKAVEGSKYFESPALYKENGFNTKDSAIKLIEEVAEGHELKVTSFDKDGNVTTELSEIRQDNYEVVSEDKLNMMVFSIEKKKEKKNPPLLYNLAELQNDCSKFFKISPNDTLNIVQNLYEKKLVTYPRTDARVLSTAISKEIHKNIGGLKAIPGFKDICDKILTEGTYKGIAKTKYVNDKQITDHYAIIPTGQGFGALNGLNSTEKKVYEIICRRFLSIFCPPATYDKVSLCLVAGGEKFFANFKVLKEEGYLAVSKPSFLKNKETAQAKDNTNPEENKDDSSKEDSSEEENESLDEEFINLVASLKKGAILPVNSFDIKEGETQPPKRYTSGSMILAMENAGKLIEDEELREQIKSSGIGTSATRAGILEKLVKNNYIAQNSKTQVLTPTLMGEMITDVVALSMGSMLQPELTASWEKGLTGVAEGNITEKEYMDKLSKYVTDKTNVVKQTDHRSKLRGAFNAAAKYYKK